ncbi:MAG: [FeFe] hydrogenase H-cluster radical SAM maturase HydE [bacterium]|jgi:biotin synthase|nr:[FeFe] hydrogenase H-cluster radical SAM maturase HydE [bacterium]
MQSRLLKIIEEAERGRPMTVEEMTDIFATDDEDIRRTLFEVADRVRHKSVGDAVYLRALVEFSNHCRNNCSYCGIRPGNRQVKRYRMEPEEIVEALAVAHRLNIGTAVLQSGEDLWYDTGKIVWMIREIKERYGMAVTLSLGERSYEDYQAFREAGADRYLLRHETSDPELYAGLHPGMTLQHRLCCLRQLKELGYQTGSGNMVGLPGQTCLSLAHDVAFIRDMGLEMAGIGPFIPAEDTPLSNAECGTLDVVLREVALLRLNSPLLMIPATTAVATLDPQGRQQALQCGANILMPNFTPLRYRERYRLYAGKACSNESFEQCIGSMFGMLSSIGRSVGKGPGHSLKGSGVYI